MLSGMSTIRYSVRVAVINGLKQSEQHMMKRHFKLSHLALALMLSIGSTGSALAASTAATATVQGTAPVLSAPSNNTPQAVDFSGTYSTPGQLSTGDTLVMTYTYKDAEGDADNSDTTVIWSYTPAGGGTDQPISATHAPAAASGGQGTSTITIPAAALGALAIKVTLQELSATGDPLSGLTINVTDTSLNTAPGGGGGGGSVTPPGPVLPGTNIAGGIFLQSDNPSAGSGATDYSRTPGLKPQVGKTYVFRAWNDTNGNGVWDAGDADVTTTLSSIQWQLTGTNTTASGTSTPVTLSNHAIPGATSAAYTVSVNGASSSGATPGDQGFSLQVSFN